MKPLALAVLAVAQLACFALTVPQQIPGETPTPELPSLAESPQWCEVTAKGDVNFRSGPGTSFYPYTVIYKGEVVLWDGVEEKGWMHLRAEVGGFPLIGYSNGEYFDRAHCDSVGEKSGDD